MIHAGFFGARIAEMARRAGTDLVELTAPLGQIVPLDQVEEALRSEPRHEARGRRARRDLDGRAVPRGGAGALHARTRHPTRC